MVAKQVIRKVGLDESVLKKSPFSLSGGEKRRVAIAGILALEPEILVLDEPGAGLDPEGKQEIFSLLSNWHEEQDLTILFVTHDMEDVARYAKDVIVMDKGTIAFYGPMRNFFANREEAKKWRNGLPSAYRFQLQLEEKMGKRLPKVCLTEEELADVLIEVGLV